MAEQAVTFPRLVNSLISFVMFYCHFHCAQINYCSMPETPRVYIFLRLYAAAGMELSENTDSKDIGGRSVTENSF